MATSPAPRLTARISVNDLARFMVSSDTARMGIIRRAKFPQKHPVIRYKDVRPVLAAYLSDAGRRVNPLVTAEEMFRQRAGDPASGPLRQDDAQKSIEVLHAVQTMGNQLKQYDFHASPPYLNKLNLAGVDISIRSDLLVYGETKGKAQIGSAIFRMTQDDADTDEAKEKRKDMGLYVATLALRQLSEAPPSNREVAARLCMSIDIQHGEVFVAPNANARRMNDVENACRMIAAIWPTI